MGGRTAVEIIKAENALNDECKKIIPEKGRALIDFLPTHYKEDSLVWSFNLEKECYTMEYFYDTGKIKVTSVING